MDKFEGKLILFTNLPSFLLGYIFAVKVSNKNENQARNSITLRTIRATNTQKTLLDGAADCL